jgi:hypothetical protein
MLRRIILFMVLAAFIVAMVAPSAGAAKRKYCTSDSLPPYTRHCAPTKKKCNAIVRANPDFTECRRVR